VNKSSEMSFCGKSEMTMFVAKSLHKKFFHMAAQLVIIDPQQIEYCNDLLQITILGGVRLEGLDRLRVTMRIEIKQSPRPPVRHNLDLYNDNQLEKFIPPAVRRLHLIPNAIRRLHLRIVLYKNSISSNPTLFPWKISGTAVQVFFRRLLSLVF
jgi:hypothetical protein